MPRSKPFHLHDNAVATGAGLGAHRRRLLALSLAAAAALAGMTAGCADPVNDDAAAALGPEDPNVPRGPLHRPGQPCLVCHSATGDAHPTLSLAGTIYKYLDGADPLANALVRFIDSQGQRYKTATNCAGNFFVQEADYAPDFPVWVAVAQDEETSMATPIFREGSCAGCHKKPQGLDSPGVVFFWESPREFPPDGCP